jgi:hypothetical protein
MLRRATALLRIRLRNARAKEKFYKVLDPSEVVEGMDTASLNVYGRGMDYSDELFLEDIESVGHITRCKWVDEFGNIHWRDVDDRQIPRKLEVIDIDDQENQQTEVH